MKLKRITLVCMGLTGAPAAALAQSSVQIYGTANVDIESVQAKGAAAGPNFASRTRLTSNSSNIGFRGSVDLDAALKAFIQIESAVNFDAGTTAGFWASRNSGVGLQSQWGQALLGQWDSPYKFSTQRIDPTNDTGIAASTGILGGTGSITAGQGGVNFAERASFDRRVSNVVQYWTPAWYGLTGRFAYGAGDTNIGSPSTRVAVNNRLNPSSFYRAVIYYGGAFVLTDANDPHT